jgi:hypothetical protein
MFDFTENKIADSRFETRAIGALFTPCMISVSLLEAGTETAGNAMVEGWVRFSTACLSFGRFRNSVGIRSQTPCWNSKSICGGVQSSRPNIKVKMVMTRIKMTDAGLNQVQILPRRFLRENIKANKSTSTSPKPVQRQENE